MILPIPFIYGLVFPAPASNHSRHVAFVADLLDRDLVIFVLVPPFGQFLKWPRWPPTVSTRRGVGSTRTDCWRGPRLIRQAADPPEPLTRDGRVPCQLHGRNTNDLTRARGGLVGGGSRIAAHDAELLRFPGLPTVARIEGDEVGLADLVDHEDDLFVDQNRRSGDAVLYIEWAEGHKPSLVAFTVIRRQTGLGKENENIDAVGDGRRRRRVVQIVAGFVVDLFDRTPPEEPSRLTVVGQHQKFFAFMGGQENQLPGQDGGGLPCWEWNLPQHVQLVAEDDGEATRLGDADTSRTPKTGPVRGPDPVSHEQDDEHCGP